jgi:hypothetical protein
LEVHFLVSLFICILGLLTTVNGKTTYAATEEALNWKAIILSIGLSLSCFLSDSPGQAEMAFITT